MYHFVTNWFLNVPIEKIWQEIADPQSWTTWFQDFKKVTPRSLEVTLPHKVLTDVEYRGNLPYTFCFTLEVTTIEPPQLMELKATGDLIGTGKWVLKSQDQGTAVSYYWDVGIANPFFNLLTAIPWIKAPTEKNHNISMERAYYALKGKLEG